MDGQYLTERMARQEERTQAIKDDIQEVKQQIEKLDQIWRGVVALIVVEVIRELLPIVL
jgi:hypothetical protein